MKEIILGETCSSTFIILLGMMMMFVYKVSNKITSSRCSEITCGCLKFKRLPLSDSRAVELATENV